MISNSEDEAGREFKELIAQFPHLEFSMFVSVAYCHICKRKKTVFGCFKNFKVLSCSKRFCNECMLRHYSEDMLRILRQEKDWLCPYKVAACICHKCN